MAPDPESEVAPLLEILQSDLCCSVCGAVYVEPLQTPCQHNFCSVCITDELRCPKCDHCLAPKSLNKSVLLSDCVEKFNLAAEAYLQEAGINILKTSGTVLATPEMGRLSSETPSATRHRTYTKASRPLSVPPLATTDRGVNRRHITNPPSSTVDPKLLPPPARALSARRATARKPARYLSSPETSIAPSVIPRAAVRSRAAPQMTVRQTLLMQQKDGTSGLDNLPKTLDRETKVNAWLANSQSPSNTSARSNTSSSNHQLEDSQLKSSPQLNRKVARSVRSKKSTISSKENLTEKNKLDEGRPAGLSATETSAMADTLIDPNEFVSSGPNHEKSKLVSKRSTNALLPTKQEHAVLNTFDELLPSSKANLLNIFPPKIRKIDAPIASNKTLALKRHTIGHSAEPHENNSAVKSRSKSLGVEHFEKNSGNGELTETNNEPANTTVAQSLIHSPGWNRIRQVKKDLKDKKMSSNPLKVKGGDMIGVPQNNTVSNTGPMASALPLVSVTNTIIKPDLPQCFDTSANSAFLGFDETERLNAKKLAEVRNKKMCMDVSLPADKSIGNITCKSNVITERERCGERTSVLNLLSKNLDDKKLKGVTNICREAKNSAIEGNKAETLQSSRVSTKGKTFAHSGEKLQTSKLSLSKSKCNTENIVSGKSTEKRCTFSLNVDTQALGTSVYNTESTQDLFAKIAGGSIPAAAPEFAVNALNILERSNATISNDVNVPSLSQTLKSEANELSFHVTGRAEGIPFLELALEGYSAIVEPQIYICGKLIPKPGSGMESVKNACVQVKFVPSVNVVDFYKPSPLHSDACGANNPSITSDNSLTQDVINKNVIEIKNSPPHNTTEVDSSQCVEIIKMSDNENEESSLGGKKKRLRVYSSSDRSAGYRKNRLQSRKKSKDVSDDENLFCEYDDSNVIPPSQPYEEAVTAFSRKRSVSSSGKVQQQQACAEEPASPHFKSYQSRNQLPLARSYSSYDQRVVPAAEGSRRQIFQRSDSNPLSAKQGTRDGCKRLERTSVADGAQYLQGSGEESDSDYLEPTPQSQGSLSLSRLKSSTRRAESPPSMCLIGSNISEPYGLLVKQFVETFKVRYVNQWQEGVTHLVTTTDVDRSAVRTYKFLCVVADKKWVLDFSWLQACLDANKILPEEPFEARDYAGIDGPRRSRLSLRRVFDNFCFFLIAPFNGDISLEDLEQLLHLAGGHTTMAVPSREDLDNNVYRNCIALATTEVLQDPTVIRDAERCLERHKILTVDTDWAMDSISIHEHKPVHAYSALLLNDDAIEKLSRFYPSIMLAFEDSMQEFEDDSNFV